MNKRFKYLIKKADKRLEVESAYAKTIHKIVKREIELNELEFGSESEDFRDYDDSD